MGLATLNNIVEKTDSLTDGLVGYWPLNEGKDNIAYDYSGNSHHAMCVNSPIWKGNSILFNGVNNYLLPRLSDKLNLNNASSFSLFLYLISYPTLSSFSWVIGKSSDSSFGSVSKWQFATIIYSDGDLAYGSGDGNISASWTNRLNINLRLNTWYHFVGIIKKDSFGYIYLNGILLNKFSVAPNTPHNINNKLLIGISDGFTKGINGLYKQVSLYNRALSPFEIKKLYNLGLSNIQNTKSII